MIETYFEEVKRKKRNARIFWLITLIISMVFYFFFKGYYISIDVDLKNFFLEKNTTQTWVQNTLTWANSSIVSVNSFGIIHIKTIPQDSEIYINNEKKYISSEKFFTDYGDYFVDFSKEWFLSGSLNFNINSQKNFYINEIFLQKNPEYKISNISDSRIFPMENNFWIWYSSGSTVLYEKNFEKPLILANSELEHIGYNKFFSWSEIVEFSPFYKKFIPVSSEIQKNFIKTCSDILINSYFLHCPETEKIITNDDKTLTGILDFGKNFAKTENSLYLWENSSFEKIDFLENSFFKNSKNFVKIGNSWFASDNFVLTEISSKNNLNKNFVHNFDKVHFVQKISDKIFVIGEEKDKNFLKIFFLNPDLEAKIIDLSGDIEFFDIRIYEKNNNFFIKTRNSLLFLYNDWNSISWLANGKILAIWEDFVIYEKNSEIWEANWEIKK